MTASSFLRIFLVFVLPIGASAQISLPEYMQQRDALSFDTIARNVAIIREVDGRYGFQNALGEWLIPAEYDYIEAVPGWLGDFPHFQDGKVMVKKMNSCGIVTWNGKPVIPCLYMHIERNSNGYTVTNHGGMSASFDRTGKQLERFTKVEEDYNDYSGPDQTYTGQKICGSNGKLLLKLDIRPYHVGIGKESEGFTLVHFFIYDEYSADVGLRKGVYGFLNRQGKWAIPPSIPSANTEWSGNGPYHSPYFHSGRALVWENEHDFRYIDTLGNTVFVPDTTIGSPSAYPFNEFGYCVVEYYKPGRLKEVVYYNTDGSERLHLTDKQQPVLNGLYSFKPYWGHLHVYDSQAQEYVFYDATLTKVVLRVPLSDSLSSNTRKLLSPHFSEYAIALTQHRGEERLTQVIDWEGNILSDWSSQTKTYDALTDMYVVRNGSSAQLVQAATGKVVFSCDSCTSNHGYDLQHAGSNLETTYGVFRFWDQHAANKGELWEVNYQGKVIYRKKNADNPFARKDVHPTWGRLDEALNRKPEPREPGVVPSLSSTPFKLTQSDFDALYRSLGWEKIRKLQKPQ